jgi:drug/metabolite transporter (DMT)-like permease
MPPDQPDIPLPTAHPRSERLLLVMSSNAPTESARFSQNVVGFALLALAILCYGGLWPVMRAAVPYIPPFWFGTTRVFIGSVVLFALLALTGQLRVPTRQDMPAVLSVGIFMLGLYVVLVHYALQFVPAGRGALLAYSTPIWVVPAAVLFLGEKLTPMRLAGMLCGLAGLTVLFNPLGFDWSDPKVLLGNGLCLLAALSWSIAILHMRGHKWNLSPLQLAPWQLLVAALVGLPFSIFLEPGTHIDFGWPLALLVFYGGVFGTALAMWSTVSAIRRIGAVTCSVGLLGGPVVATAISVMFLGEPLTLTLASGLVLILSGVAMVSLAQAWNR